MSKNLFSQSALLVSVGAFVMALLFLAVTTHSVKETELQKLLELRNEDEWKLAWHLEKHVRCRDQLLTHMDWACQKDIYKLDKKSNFDPNGIFIGRALANSVIKPWSGYVRRKREEKSITDECCSPAGCTWEEYAEYCTAHRRNRITRSSDS